MFGFNPRPVSGPITREGLRAVLERKASLLLGDPVFSPDAGVDSCSRAALAAAFTSRRHPQNKFEVVVNFSPGFSCSKLVRVQRNYYSGFTVDCDRFTIELRGAQINTMDDGEVLQLTPGVANLLDRIYIDGGDEFGIFGSLVAVKCAAITDATVDRLLHHIRLLEGVQSCACGRAFVYAGPPEACDACLMCASAEVLSEVEVCAICRDDAHTSFAHKCPDCSCLLHQSCLYKLCYSDTFGFAKCPQCRRTLKRPAEVELTVL
ncbi:hypothetical protein Rsub_03975 [Raphidocelis subcapitata]|uniref:RING-type domain-containing protein n=1 Tax=Raphidocelis subcapitata TaxID=307507 RepID=A0A2V0NVL7_9CHLO|nr:hypothetical protein Rsub_03975 [Raphidocelis subcapitata]|eukprot:GBF91671.1 hypothetical protein Rsub_03975 [Raphidocelis subcapitata]